MHLPTKLNVPGPGNGRGWGTAGVRRQFDHADWTGSNRISLWIYPDNPGSYVNWIELRIYNDGEEKLPALFGQEGETTVMLRNHQWNHVVWEIGNVARDRITSLEISYYLCGNEPEASDTVTFYLDLLELQQTMIASKDLQLTHQFSPEGATFRIDSIQIRQVLLNLLHRVRRPDELVSSQSYTDVHLYAPDPGLPEVREAVAAFFRSHKGVPGARAEEVMLTCGANQAYVNALCTLTRPGDEVITFGPGYFDHDFAIQLAGCVNVEIALGRTEHGFRFDLDRLTRALTDRTRAVTLVSPGNPTGAVMDIASMQRLIELADKFDFVIASDECYSEIYFDESNPPPGLLEAATNMGRDNYERCIVFHSLSKCSNVPGLRSGFVAGDKKIMQKFLLYRTYHGCAMPEFAQHSSICLWNDEQHVKDNRDQYREKFSRVTQILSGKLNVTHPDAAFYLWPETPIDEQDFAQQLFAQQNVTVLPGSYLSRVGNGLNPGTNRVRIALVASVDECVEAANRMIEFIDTL